MALSYKDDEKQDERLDPYSDNARNLYKQENDSIPGYDRANDGLDDHPVTAGDASGKSGDTDASKNINAAKEKEQQSAGSPLNYTGTGGKKAAKEKVTLKSLAKEKGPFAALLAVLTGGGMFFGLGVPLAPLALVEPFINDGNDLNKSSQRKTINGFGATLGGDLQKKMSICTAMVSFRCKLNTLTPEKVLAFEDKNFTFENKVERNGRVGFTSMSYKLPNGEVLAAKSAQDLKTHFGNPDFARSFNSVHSLRNAPFLSKFFDGVLKGQNLSKAKKIEGDTKEKVDKSYDDSVKGEKGTAISTSAVGDDPGQNATEEQKRAAQANTDAGNETSKTINGAISRGQKIKSLSLKIGNPLALPQLACLTYNMSGYIATTAKIVKAARFASFAMIFLTLASSIKAGQATEAEVAKGMSIISPSEYPEKIEDPETGEMVANPNIGKNAFDSEAYKVVAYGDEINLSSIFKAFFIAGGFLGILDSVVSWMNNNIGKTAIKTTCKIANSTVANVIAFLAAPVFGIALAGLAQLLPIDKWAAELVNLAIDAAAGADLTTGLAGVDAGNVLFIGTAVIMGAAAMKFGLKPGKLEAIRKNIADNNKLIQEEIALERHEAKKAPFDLSNPHSFLGSLVSGIVKFMPSVRQPAALSISKLFSVLPASLGTLTKNVGAAYSMPVTNYSEKRFSQCPDETYREIEIQPDMGCVVRYVPFGEVGSGIIALDNLESRNQVDNNGAPTPGSYFEKYTKYCVDRSDPWGSTSVAAESQTDEPDWYTGKKCLEDTIENQMSSEFTGYKVTQGIIDETPSSNTQAFLDNSSGNPIAGMK